MKVSTLRIGAAALALALVAIGWAQHAPWLAVVAVLLTIVAIAFTTT